MKEQTIQESLEKMKRKEIMDLAFRLNLPPPPKGREAFAVWRAGLAQELPGMDLAVRECLGMIGITNLLNCMAEDCDDDLTVSIARMCGAEAEYDLNTLRGMGLAWRDRSRWHIQGCVPDMLAVGSEEERALLEASDDLEDVIRGYLMFYGMLRADELQRLLFGRSSDQAAEVILTVWSRRRGLAGLYPLKNEVWMLGDELMDPETLYRQILRPDRRGIPYAVYSEKRVREALKLGVTGDPAIVRQLVALGRRVHIRRPEMLGRIVQAEDAFRREDRHSAIEILCVDFEGGKYAPLALTLSTRYISTIPAWHVKGHTLAEVHEEDRTPKTAWSAPCPCGSGRIYGRCCGRAQ